MGNHKVDRSEVDNFANDLQAASEEIHSSLAKVKEQIDTINSMDSWILSQVKPLNKRKVINELHLTVLASFQGVFKDLNENL